MGRRRNDLCGSGASSVITFACMDAHLFRYTMFYILYPIGIGAEWWLMYKSIEPVGKISPMLPPVFYFLLALYVPGMLLS